MNQSGETPYLLIDPVLVRMGPFEIHWYGVMYLLGFIVAYFVIRSELRRKGPVSPESAEDMLFYMIVGLLVGARLGYVLFYNLPHYLEYPLDLLAFWKGGMSFHGGLVGIVVAGVIFAKRRHAPFLELADIGALSAPLGLMLGRFGNFINGELYGRITDLPWGIVFPTGGPHPRHPSQLYESFFEGPVLFGFLWWLRLRTRNPGEVLAAFLMGYGILRFIIEFFREPDSQLGFIVSFLTMGQVLCLCMIAAGLGLLIFVRKKKES